MSAVAKIEPGPKAGVLAAVAGRYSMDPENFKATIKGTVFPATGTNEELAAFLVVANEYKLNPLTREIYAFPKKGGGIVPIVSIDGWISLVNSHPQFKGVEFVPVMTAGGLLAAYTCSIWRKDRDMPTVITEYLDECIRPTDPWKMKNRMLRHKALIQCARYAFGFSGVYDEDEGRDVSENVNFRDVTPPAPPAPPKIKGPVIDAKAEPERPAEKVAEVQAAAPPAAEQPEEPLIEIGYDPDTVIADLIDMLSRCKTVEEVEVGYDTFDAEAALAHFEQADYVARARQIKKQHLDRVEAAAAKSAPPKPPEAEKKANTLDDDSPPVPPATEPDLSTLEAYNSYVRNVVGGWYDPVKISQWWTETRAVRTQLDMSMEMRKSLQDYLENRMKAADAAAR
jgi:hypothetical protein